MEQSLQRSSTLGIARILTKADVATLKKSHKDLEALNSDMEKASLLVSAHAVDTVIFWSFVARCITHITNKGKFTFEGVVYTSLEDIKSNVIVEIAKAKGVDSKDIEHTWTLAAQRESKLDSATLEANKAMKLETLDSPAFLAKKAGFVLGKACFEKASSKNKFVLNSIGTDVKLTEHLLHGVPIVRTIPLVICLKNWQPYKNDLPTVLPSAACNKHSFTLRSITEFDTQVARYFAALCAYHEKVAVMTQTKLVYHIRPSELVNEEPLKKGALILALVVGLANVVIKKGGSTQVQTGHFIKPDVQILINKPSQPNSGQVKEWKQDVFLSPFFWVDTTRDESLANCELKLVKSDGVTIPIITNVKVLKPHVPLVYFVAATEVTPLQGATIVAATKKRKAVV